MEWNMQVYSRAIRDDRGVVHGGHAPAVAICHDHAELGEFLVTAGKGLFEFFSARQILKLRYLALIPGKSEVALDRREFVTHRELIVHGRDDREHCQKSETESNDRFLYPAEKKQGGSSDNDVEHGEPNLFAHFLIGHAEVRSLERTYNITDKNQDDKSDDNQNDFGRNARCINVFFYSLHFPPPFVVFKERQSVFVANIIA